MLSLPQLLGLLPLNLPELLGHQTRRRPSFFSCDTCLMLSSCHTNRIFAVLSWLSRSRASPAVPRRAGLARERVRQDYSMSPPPPQTHHNPAPALLLRRTAGRKDSSVVQKNFRETKIGASHGSFFAFPVRECEAGPRVPHSRIWVERVHTARKALENRIIRCNFASASTSRTGALAA